ncbi:MAG: hypothetical protein IJ427_12600 [Lachnospiraceae bacterium]|nr:hypothetical protein [Lachnospiraceae bacterium]
MLFKRFLTVATIATLLLTSFAACSQKKNNDTDTTPTPTGTVDIPLEGFLSTTTTPSPDSIILGGYFDRENINISIYYTDTWYINGIYYKDSTSASRYLNGTLSHKDGAELIFTDDSNELSFVFTHDSMTIKANKGTDYSVFEGFYQRKEQAISTEEAIVPTDGSALELIGRTALTYYMLAADGLLDCMIQLDEMEYNNEFATNFLLTYTDLFLVSKAEFSESISDRYLCYAFSEEELSKLLSAASNDRLNLKNLDFGDSTIIYKDNTYYVPCRGNYAGGISSRFTSGDPESIPALLILDGAVTKQDGTMYRMEMTLTTSSENAAEATGVAIQSIRYKVTK